MDVDTMEPGIDFVEAINEAVGSCEALLAVIGPDWVVARSEGGARRLDNPDDYVRLEIEAALRRGVRVVPVLVEGAVMPSAEELPQALAGLARRNALQLTHERWATDIDPLLAVVERDLGVRPDRGRRPKHDLHGDTRPGEDSRQGGTAGRRRSRVRRPLSQAAARRRAWFELVVGVIVMFGLSPIVYYASSDPEGGSGFVLLLFVGLVFLVSGVVRMTRRLLRGRWN